VNPEMQAYVQTKCYQRAFHTRHNASLGEKAITYPWAWVAAGCIY
jgi:hypothetical protein